MTDVQNIHAELVPNYLSSTESDPRKVTYTPGQLAALEKFFPEPTDGNMTTEQLRHRVGQRSIIQFIRDRVRR